MPLLAGAARIDITPVGQRNQAQLSRQTRLFRFWLEQNVNREKSWERKKQAINIQVNHFYE